MKHAKQIEDLVSQNAILENRNSEHYEEIKKLQSKIIEVQNHYAEFKEQAFNSSNILDQS